MRTGKAKQHYLHHDVIALIKRKKKEKKMKSHSAYVNGVFMLMLEYDDPLTPSERKAVIGQFMEMVK